MPAWTSCPVCAALVTDPALHAAWHAHNDPTPDELEETHDGD